MDICSCLFWVLVFVSDINAAMWTWDWQADFNRYHNYSEIMAWLEVLVQHCDHPNVETFTVGQSYEGRNLTGVKIESRFGPGSDGESIWIDGGTHGNEWISHATAMYLAARFCDGRDRDSFAMLKTWNIYILPVVNPDAYEYTWTTDRMWRPTRKPTVGDCIGSDPNRNWKYMWATTGVNLSNPCDSTFPGTKPFSEPETAAVSAFIMSRKGKWIAFLNMHSAWEMWIPPWGYTKEEPEDYEDLRRVCKKAAEAAKITNGKDYICKRTQGNSGTVKDWAKGRAGIKYSYTVELRANQDDTYSKFSQILPPKDILPSAEETWASIVAMTTEIKDIEPAKYYKTPCFPENPCQNGGRCHYEEDPLRLGYYCLCVKPFGGYQCQLEDPCRNDPCPPKAVNGCWATQYIFRGRLCFDEEWELIDI